MDNVRALLPDDAHKPGDEEEVQITLHGDRVKRPDIFSGCFGYGAALGTDQGALYIFTICQPSKKVVDLKSAPVEVHARFDMEDSHWTFHGDSRRLRAVRTTSSVDIAFMQV